MSGSDPPRSVRRSPRLSPQQASDSSKSKDGVKGGGRGRNSLQEAKRRGRMERSREEQELSGKLSSLDLSRKSAAAGTGLVYSETFTRHQNQWDPSHPECPDRVTSIMEELQKQELLSRCVRVEPRDATEEELLLTHTKNHVDKIRATEKMTEAELRTLSETFDSVYLHPETFRVCLSAVGSVLRLVDLVMTSELRNGFAIIRPPGHHAQADECNGYSMFNNVAIAARYARTRHNVSRSRPHLTLLLYQRDSLLEIKYSQN